MPGEEPARSWLASAAAAVALRPALWGTAAHQLRALADPGWLRRRPHLPLPPAAYLRFRLVTAYGDPEASPAPADVVAYLSWCREERRRVRYPRRRRWRNAPVGARVGR
ncbi:MAG: hypothetical protein AVDCRST_MAG20-1247 [uncultured Acidimicrobiales bacterium]|uniref:Uncharacterized protein n=1 Tax=uncultured Acidimicrobiales bacterium TaxID=310071 RepID=A0A6J4HRL7_9ACTN|nr:MAG: hypothetical protein AVDCRST_MAG20-1247 [uncultured Acidimicrobiales bacterium]